jgi:drug/metabolite transporter (DMT)-like permease
VWRRHRLTRADLVAGVWSGVFMVGGYFLQALGLRTTSAGSSAFLTCAGTLLTAFWAWPLLGQRPSGRLLAGIFTALAGSALMTLGPGLRIGAGDAWTLLGAASFALQVVAVARHAPAADPMAMVCVQSFVVALVTLPFAGPWQALAPVSHGAGLARFAYLVLAGSAVAPLLQVLAQRVLPAGRVGLLFALEPVFALLIALTLGGEWFGPRWWIGAALILVAVVGVELRSAD